MNLYLNCPHCGRLPLSPEQAKHYSYRTLMVGVQCFKCLPASESELQVEIDGVLRSISSRELFDLLRESK